MATPRYINLGATCASFNIDTEPVQLDNIYIINDGGNSILRNDEYDITLNTNTTPTGTPTSGPSVPLTLNPVTSTLTWSGASSQNLVFNYLGYRVYSSAIQNPSVYEVSSDKFKFSLYFNSNLSRSAPGRINWRVILPSGETFNPTINYSVSTPDVTTGASGSIAATRGPGTQTIARTISTRGAGVTWPQTSSNFTGRIPVNQRGDDTSRVNFVAIQAGDNTSPNNTLLQSALQNLLPFPSTIDGTALTAGTQFFLQYYKDVGTPDPTQVQENTNANQYAYYIADNVTANQYNNGRFDTIDVSKDVLFLTGNLPTFTVSKSNLQWDAAAGVAKVKLLLNITFPTSPPPGSKNSYTPAEEVGVTVADKQNIISTKATLKTITLGNRVFCVVEFDNDGILGGLSNKQFKLVSTRPAGGATQTNFPNEITMIKASVNPLSYKHNRYLYWNGADSSPTVSPEGTTPLSNPLFSLRSYWSDLTLTQIRRGMQFYWVDMSPSSDAPQNESAAIDFYRWQLLTAPDNSPLLSSPSSQNATSNLFYSITASAGVNRPTAPATWPATTPQAEITLHNNAANKPAITINTMQIQRWAPPVASWNPVNATNEYSRPLFSNREGWVLQSKDGTSNGPFALLYVRLINQTDPSISPIGYMNISATNETVSFVDFGSTPVNVNVTGAGGRSWNNSLITDTNSHIYSWTCVKCTSRDSSGMCTVDTSVNPPAATPPPERTDYLPERVNLLTSTVTSTLVPTNIPHNTTRLHFVPLGSLFMFNSSGPDSTINQMTNTLDVVGTGSPLYNILSRTIQVTNAIDMVTPPSIVSSGNNALGVIIRVDNANSNFAIYSASTGSLFNATPITVTDVDLPITRGTITNPTLSTTGPLQYSTTSSTAKITGAFDNNGCLVLCRTSSDAGQTSMYRLFFYTRKPSPTFYIPRTPDAVVGTMPVISTITGQTTARFTVENLKCEYSSTPGAIGVVCFGFMSISNTDKAQAIYVFRSQTPTTISTNFGVPLSGDITQQDNYIAFNLHTIYYGSDRDGANSYVMSVDFDRNNNIMFVVASDKNGSNAKVFYYQRIANGKYAATKPSGSQVFIASSPTVTIQSSQENGTVQNAVFDDYSTSIFITAANPANNVLAPSPAANAQSRFILVHSNGISYYDSINNPLKQYIKLPEGVTINPNTARFEVNGTIIFVDNEDNKQVRAINLMR